MIIGSSLLFLYDKKQKKCQIRLIDIADMHEEGKEDIGMSLGFQNMLQILNELK